jgi:radical SAM family uncharacterized protein
MSSSLSPSVLERLHRILPHVQKPARYIGNEKNVVRKDGKVDLRMVISYPDVYEIGMSNLGLRILYEAVNAVPNLSCERVFAPWLDLEEVLRKNGIPLFSLESFTPLFRFDVVGFSLGYELLYTNLLAVLDLGGIPLRSVDRGEGCPIVIAGGPAALNPESIADFIDVFLLGDGEKALVEFLLAAVSLRGRKRNEVLSELNRFDFTYVPSLYGTRAVQGYLFTDIDKIVKRRIEPDLDTLPYPLKPLVPITRIVQERVNVEVSRGCVTGCRFCQAGFIYRPVRERSTREIMVIVDSGLRQTGYDEVSLVSLNVGEFSALEDLVRSINDRYSRKGVSVSLPSLKVNSVNLKVLEMIREVRKSGLTFAVESADERVRSALNKPVGEGQLRDIIRKVSELGWKLVKLYFMIGLPTAEREGEAIERFVLGLAETSPRLALNVNVSVFVPKPHTPFEREKQLDEEEAERIIQYLRKRFGRSKIRIKFQNPKMSLVEGLLSRGDRSVSRVVEAAFRQGERFSSWDDVFDYGKWESALSETAVDVERYLAFCDDLDPLPWGFIDSGVKKNYLIEERRRAEAGAITGSCLEDDCPGCGACGGDLRNRAARPGAEAGGERTAEGEASEGKGEERVGHPVAIPAQEQVFKILFQFTKMGLFRYLSHLDLLHLFARALRTTGLPVASTKGFNPKPRLSIPFPLVLGAESRCELGEVFFVQPVAAEVFVERMNAVLARDLEITRAQGASEKKSIAAKQFFHDYVITLREDIGAELGNLCSTIVKNSDRSENILRYEALGPNAFSVRLRGSTSVRDMLNKHSISHLDCSILRTGLGEERKGIFFDFFQ